MESISGYNPFNISVNNIYYYDYDNIKEAFLDKEKYIYAFEKFCSSLDLFKLQVINKLECCGMLVGKISNISLFLMECSHVNCDTCYKIRKCCAVCIQNKILIRSGTQYPKSINNVYIDYAQFCQNYKGDNALKAWFARNNEE